MADDTRRDRLMLAMLAVGILASRLVLLHHRSSPEPDSLAMVAGMTMALKGDVPLREAFLYGREGSPGMYFAGYLVYPLFSRDPAHLLQFLNWVTVLASVALVWPAYALARRFFSREIATAVVLISLLAPAVWELSTYFHPEITAVTLLLLAVWAEAGSDRSRLRVLRTFLAVLLGIGALVCRFHVLFVLPGLILAAWLSSRRVRHFLTLAITLAAGLAGYALLQAAVAGPDQPGSAGFLRYAATLADMYTRSFSLSGLNRSWVWATCGMGVATVAALIAALLWRARRFLGGDRQRCVSIGLVWALPSLLFWLPQPTPILRHYVLSTFGLVLALGALLSMVARRNAVAVAAIIACLNVAVPEAAYRVHNAVRPHAAKTPHGAVFYSHEVAEKRIRRFDAAAARVVQAMRADGSLGAVVFAQWEGYAHVVYALVNELDGVRPVSTLMFFPTVQERRYEAGNCAITFINYVYFEDPELIARGIELMRDRIEQGHVVLVPSELANGSLKDHLTDLPVTIY